MKFHNIIVAAAVAGTSLTASAYDNTTAVNLITTADNAPAAITIRQGGSTIVTRPSVENDSARWVIFRNAELGMNFVVNVGAERFLASDGTKSVLTDVPTPVIVAPRDNGGAAIIDARSGGVIGLPEALAGSNILLQSDSVKGSDPFVIGIRDNGTLSAAKQAAVEALCSTKAVTEGRIAVFRAFVEAQRQAARPDMAGFVGVADVEALDKAIGGGAPLDEMEALYEDAVASQYPRSGHYYRLHNTSRPTAAAKGNILSLQTGGNFIAGAVTPALGSTGKRAEDLSLFTFEADPAAPSVAYVGAASMPGYYFNNWGITRLSEQTQATMMELQRRSSDPYVFRMRRTDAANIWLTVSGSYELVGYGQEEDPEWWWLEEVTEIPVTLGADGLAAVMLPCPVELPAGTKAFVATAATPDLVTITEIGSVVPAATPVILEGAPGAALSLAMAHGDYSLTVANRLFGLMAKMKDEPATCYLPSRDKDGAICFVRTESAAGPGANDAWLPVPMGAEADVIPTEIGTSGITAPEADSSARPDADGDIYYDLQGRRLARPADRGVYINATTGRVRLGR